MCKVIIGVCVSVHRPRFELCTLCARPVSQLGLLISKSIQDKGVGCEGALFFYVSVGFYTIVCVVGEKHVSRSRGFHVEV